jgi:putative heme iron utilization protein
MTEPDPLAAHREGAGHPVEPALADIARQILKNAEFAALATLATDGAPFATLVAMALSADGAPMMLLSRLAVHTENLERDPRASLLIADAAEAGNPLENPRLTLTGEVEPIAKHAATRESFLSRHPDAAAYVDFADFTFFRFRTTGAHLVAGFGRIARIPPFELLLPSS